MLITYEHRKTIIRPLEGESFKVRHRIRRYERSVDANELAFVVQAVIEHGGRILSIKI